MVWFRSGLGQNSIKGQIVNILVFVENCCDYLTLSSCTEAPVDNTETNEHNCVPVNFICKDRQQARFGLWDIVYSLYILGVRGEMLVWWKEHQQIEPSDLVFSPGSASLV